MKNYKNEFLKKQIEDLNILLNNYNNQDIREYQIERLKIFNFMNTDELNLLIEYLDYYKDNNAVNKILQNEISIVINNLNKEVA